jgi:hypothetical protein
VGDCIGHGARELAGLGGLQRDLDEHDLRMRLEGEAPVKFSDVVPSFETLDM